MPFKSSEITQMKGSQSQSVGLYILMASPFLSNYVARVGNWIAIQKWIKISSDFCILCLGVSIKGLQFLILVKLSIFRTVLFILKIILPIHNRMQCSSFQHSKLSIQCQGKSELCVHVLCSMSTCGSSVLLPCGNGTAPAFLWRYQQCWVESSTA